MSDYLYSVDPGVHGAICWWNGDVPGRIWDIDLNELDLLAATFIELGRETVVLETTHAQGRNGVKSNFQQGYVRGLIHMTVVAHGHALVEVSPQVWKAKLGLTGQDKEASRLLALELYPDLEPYLRRKKDHDRAEAVLIGHWYRTHERNPDDD